MSDIEEFLDYVNSGTDSDWRMWLKGLNSGSPVKIGNAKCEYLTSGPSYDNTCQHLIKVVVNENTYVLETNYLEYDSWEVSNFEMDSPPYLSMFLNTLDPIDCVPKNPESIKAMQWLDFNESSMISFLGWNNFQYLEEFDRGDDPEATGSVFIPKHSTWELVTNGDWVVVTKNGEDEVIEVLSNEDFNRSYSISR